MGGGGYGDPLDRDPAAVLNDVLLGLVTVGAAYDIYGVVVNHEEQIVDLGASAERRLAIRAERLGHEPKHVRSARAAVPATGRRLSEYLQITAEGATQCTWCGGEVAPAGVHWKDRAALRRWPVARAGALRPSPEFILIEACCPDCGTLLDTDLAAGDDPPLYDRIEAWPEAAPA
jgi:N-methylhydantoinase B